MKQNGKREKLVDKGIFVDLCKDPGFKAVFADINHKSLLIGLLNEILPQNAQIKDIVRYLDREQIVETAYSKKSVLDLVCVSDDLRTFDVEIQCKKDPVFFERCIYYASGFYSRSIMKGEDYDKLHPVYVVSFIDFSLDFEAFSITGQLVDDTKTTFKSTYDVYQNSGAGAANGIKSDFISSGEATFTMTGISKTIRNLVSLKNITVKFSDDISASVGTRTLAWTETKSCTISIPQTNGHNKWGPVTVLNAVAVFSTPDGNDYQVSFANPSMTRHITGLPFNCENFSNEEGNWNKSTYAIAFKTSGIYFFQGTTASPSCTLKQNIYSPSEVSVSMDAEFYKESKTIGFNNAKLKLSLGTLILSTKDTKTQTLSINGTISGNSTLKGSFSYGGANLTAEARIGKIHIFLVHDNF